MATAVQTEHGKKRFLDAFAKCGNVSEAARQARIRRPNVYDWQEHDPAFLLAYREAEIASKAVVEMEIRRRAVVGWNEPVYQGGVKVGTVRKFSDLLLIFLAKRLMPEYRDKVTVDVNQVVRSYRNVDVDRV